MSRDPIAEEVGLNLYLFSPFKNDRLGQLTIDSLSEGVIQGLAVGEIVAVARMLGLASVAAFLKAMDESGYKLRCMPCKPPVGTQRQQCHDVVKGIKNTINGPNIIMYLQ